MSNPNNATPTVPAAPLPSGTIDITNLVSNLKRVWIKWAVAMVLAELAAVSGPFGAFLASPAVAYLLKFGVEKVVTIVANAIEMQGFFLNTALRKAGQAREFTDAVDAKDALPATASEREYEDAEKRQMLAFTNFVRVNN